MIWEVNPGALDAKPTARIEILSKHKDTLPEYEQHKDRSEYEQTHCFSVENIGY